MCLRITCGQKFHRKIIRCRIKRRQWNYTVKDVLSAESHLLREEHSDAARNAEYAPVEGQEKCANRKRDRC